MRTDELVIAAVAICIWVATAAAWIRFAIHYRRVNQRAGLLGGVRDPATAFSTIARVLAARPTHASAGEVEMLEVVAKRSAIVALVLSAAFILFAATSIAALSLMS
jgi:hypothetical protein